MTTSAGFTGTTRLLVASCHPLPTIAVTAFTAGLAVAIGLRATTVVVVVIAVLCGQLSIGWSNDAIDASRDAAAGRTDKPLSVSPDAVGTVWTACGVAVLLCVALSLSVGLRPGTSHLLAVGAGWSYNVWLKSSGWSWVPFAVAFGLLPVFVYGGLPTQPLPPAWVVVCAALLGVGAHLINAAPDRADDEAAGVRGAAVRWGARRAVGVAFACFGAAAAVAVASWGAAGGATWARAALVAVAVVLTSAGIVMAVSRGDDAAVQRTWFRAALVLVAAEVVLILTAA